MGSRMHGTRQSQLTHDVSPPSVLGSKPVGPESEASGAVRSFSLYTNSCIFLLLFIARGARPSVLPAPLGLRHGFAACLAGLGEQGRQSP